MVAEGLWGESKGQKEKGTTRTDREKLPWTDPAWLVLGRSSGWSTGRNEERAKLSSGAVGQRLAAAAVAGQFEDKEAEMSSGAVQQSRLDVPAVQQHRLAVAAAAERLAEAGTGAGQLSRELQRRPKSEQMEEAAQHSLAERGAEKSYSGAGSAE